MTSTFKIALLSAGTNPASWTAVSTLLSNGGDIDQLPDWSFTPYPEFTERGDGGRSGQGLPVAAWRWKALRAEQRENLRDFCSALSAEVYIQTPTNETTSGARVWKNYRCQMLWMPVDENTFDAINTTQDVDLEFRMCVEVP